MAAVADEIAAAADLIKQKTTGVPVAIVRGLSELVTEAAGPGARAQSSGPPPRTCSGSAPLTC